MKKDCTLISLMVLLLFSGGVFTTTKVCAEDLKQSSSNLVKDSSTQIKESQEQKSSLEDTEESSNILKSATTTESNTTVEKLPDAQINFKTEHLINLVANANYKVNNQMVTADGRGEILIDKSWFGKNIYIIKSGSNISADSDAQCLSIPNKPNITLKQDDIIVQNHEISYKNPVEGVKYTIDGLAPQNDSGNIVFKNLESGKKYLLKAVKEATNDSFKSECTAILKTITSSNTQEIEFGGLAHDFVHYSFLRMSFSNNMLIFRELRDGPVHIYYGSSLYCRFTVKGKNPFTHEYRGDSDTRTGYTYTAPAPEGSEIDIYHCEIGPERWISRDPDLSFNDIYNGSNTQVFHIKNGRIVHDWQVMPPTLSSVKDSDTHLTGKIPKQSIIYGRSYTLRVYVNGAVIGSESVKPDTSYNYSFPKNIKLHGGDKVAVQLSGTSSSGPYKSNTSVMVSKDVIATPAFVVIPKNLSLHDNVSSAVEELKLLDSQNNLYQGGATATITIYSKNNFKFSNGGEYQIIDEKKQPVSSPVLLSRGNTIKKIQAILTKKAKINKISNDSLMFNYSIKN